METLAKKNISDHEEINNNLVKSNLFWHSKNGKVTKFILQVVFAIFLTMSLIRVPYVGSFFDAVFFSILFGYTKYFAYLSIYLFLIVSWVPKWKYKIFNVKNMLLIGGIWLMVSIIISSIGILINYNVLSGNGLVFKQYFVGEPESYFDYWVNNDWNNVNRLAWFYLNPKSYGGIFSFALVVLFESLSPLVLAVLMTTSIGAILVWKFKKYYNKHKVSNNFANDNSYYESWIKQQSNYSLAKKNAEALMYIESLDSKTHKLPIGSLKNVNETSEDYKQDLTNYCDKFINRMESFLVNWKIDFSLLKKEIMFKSFICTFKFNDRKSKKLLTEHLDDLKAEFSDTEINYYFDEDNNFVISQKIDLKPIVSMREVINAIGTKNRYCFGLGKLSDRHNIYIKGLLKPNIAVFGSKGSGHGMFVSNLILSLASLNDPTLLAIDIVDTSAKTLKTLSHLPQTNAYATTNDEWVNVLDQIINVINMRLQLLKDYKCKDIYTYYNKITKTNDLKVHLLVIHGLEDLILWNKSEYLEKLQFILENAFNVGIMNIFSSSVVNSDTIHLLPSFDSVACFKLALETESWDAIDDPSACYLWGNGDGLIKTSGTIYHFQTPFVNKEETSFIIDTIKQAYSNKEEK